MKKPLISYCFIILSLVGMAQDENSKSTSFNDHIIQAEKMIIGNQYRNAIIEYNISWHIKNLPPLSKNNYKKILELDSNLNLKYKDTLQYFGTYYNKKAQEQTKESNNKTPARDICQNFNDSIEYLMNLDRNIRSHAMMYVKQVEMYTIEPYKSEIYTVDSINYLNLYKLLSNSTNYQCFDNIFTKSALMDHMLKINLNESSQKLDELLVSLSDKGYLDKKRLIGFLFNSYNTAKWHKQKKEYNTELPIEIINNNIFFVPTSIEKLDSINTIRKKYDLENMSTYLSKLIWQLNQNNFQFYYYNKWKFSNDEEEKKFSDDLLKHHYIKQRIYGKQRF